MHLSGQKPVPEGSSQPEGSASEPDYADMIPTHVAETLTAGGPTARILLDGQIYTLRITRTGKLILTK